jgi:PIN domain nuclease of toxin-antitoxin system
MRLLLDTHVFVWWLDDAPRLSRRLRALIANTQNEVFVSAVSAFEITTKFRLGKLPAAAAFVHDLANLVERSGFRDLPLTTIHATRAGLFPNPPVTTWIANICWGVRYWWRRCLRPLAQ